MTRSGRFVPMVCRTSCALILLFGVGACDRGLVTDIAASHPTYQAGQVWTYKTRPGEENSRVTILRVDKHPDSGAYIVHVAVEGLAIASPSAPGGVARTISHLPFAEEAVARSLVQVERSAATPEFREGYQTWRTSFDQKKAGVWSVPIAEAVAAMESVLSGTK